MNTNENNNELVNETVETVENVETVEAAETVEAPKAEKKQKKSTAARKRTLKYGGTATAITIVGIIVIMIINMVATALTDRFGLTVDMTSNSLFKLSEKTIDYVEDIEKDIDIYVLIDEDDYKNMGIYYASSASIIESYAQINSRITVSYEDIITNPTFVSQFPDLTLSQGDIVVASADRAVSVSQNDLVTATTNQQTGSYTINSTAEQAMTSAILTVASDEIIKVSVLTGYDNADASAVTSLFSKNNYVVTEQVLMNEEIDPDAEIAVLYGITRDLDEESVKKIEKWLDNDEKADCRALYYFVSSDTALEEMENFGSLLEDWGITVSTDFVYETDNAHKLNGNAFYTVPDVINTDVSGGIENKNLPITMFNARRVELTDTGFNNEALLQFSDGARAFPLQAAIDGKSTAEVDGEKMNDACAVACSTYTQFEGSTPVQSRIVVFSSSLAFSSTALTGAYYGNADYLMSLSNKVTDNSTYVYIAEKNMDTASLAVTSSQMLTILLVFIILLPLAIVVAGIIVWIRRRHR